MRLILKLNRYSMSKFHHTYIFDSSNTLSRPLSKFIVLYCLVVPAHHSFKFLFFR